VRIAPTRDFTAEPVARTSPVIHVLSKLGPTKIDEPRDGLVDLQIDLIT
jgi:hypothetical protein